MSTNDGVFGGVTIIRPDLHDCATCVKTPLFSGRVLVPKLERENAKLKRMVEVLTAAIGNEDFCPPERTYHDESESCAECWLKYARNKAEAE